MTPPALPPGFMVLHGNRPESLRDLLVNWTTRHPLAPLENETILVQSNGIAQWLRLALARDVEDGGCGIAAALDLQLPARFIWQAYRAVLGEDAVPATSPFDRSLLVWRLMRLLPALLADPQFAPLQRFLERDADLRRRYQLAERLADLLDQYQVYRADWLAAWAEGDDGIETRRLGRQPLPDSLRWQPRLWRALLQDVGPAQAGSSRAVVHQRFLAAVAAQRGQQRPAGLPRRLLVFGISSMPQQALEVLAAVAGWTQVLMCVHNPCQHHWAHIVADKDLLRATRSRQGRRAGTPDHIDESLLHLHAHPLLAAWGRQGRDFIHLLDVHDEREQYEQRFRAIDQRIDLFESPGEATLLQQLQDDILDLRPLAETRERWPGVDARADRSLRFHIAHGPQREVEILHDQLLAAFAADPSLRPRDIIVMVPDINAYAPHVQAVFGLLEPADPRHIPFTLADQGQRHHDPLLGALEKILALPQSRLAVSDLLDLLEVPALRARFGIGADQLPLLHRWVRKANIRWGLHAAHRASLDLPQAPSENSWFWGLRRMLLGYAVGAGEAWQGVEPLDEIGGLDAALLGPLVRLLDGLDRIWRTLVQPATPPEWGERLRELLKGFFLADEGRDGFTLLRLESGLQDWLDACAGAALHEALPLSVVREHWLAQLDQSSLSLPFFAGAVTFATLMPMRAIPFRRVCLLGMNDGDYPRTRVPMDFDLMGRDYRPGDRSRREDDRYLFLEALLSARDHLHISWVGRSIHDHSERPPSVLVAQLRDHVAAGWRLDGDEAPVREAGAALLAALTTEHKLQPFSRAYFTGNGDDGLFSHAREWREGLAPSPALAGEAGTQTPSPASAGEGRGEGGSLGRTQASGSTSDAPHPNPLPLMRERGYGGAPLPPTRELPPFRWDAELTIALLSDFLRDPVRAFFQQRLRVHFETADPASEDQEPFALDALENWQLQDELIRAQLAAPARGVPREAALAAQLERIQRRGELPAGQFAVAVAAGLAAPMADLFERHDKALADWPEPADDEALDYEHPAGTPPLHVADWLGELRRNARGERGRVLLSSTGLLKDQHYRRDKLVPYWVAHLAGHLNGAPLTTVIVSKNGDVTLPPLPLAQARQHWDELLQAWQQGMHRPLPLALRTAFAWLQKGGAAGQGPDTEAGRAARACYEVHEPEHLRFAECEESPYLGRAYPGFDHLWADGEFAQWADRLLRPLSDALGSARAGRQAAGVGA